MLDKLHEEFQPYRTLWARAFFFDSQKDQWQVSPLSKLQSKKIENELEKIKVEIKKKLQKTFQEQENSFALKVTEELLGSIKDFEGNIRLIQLLTKECLQKKSNNWKQLFSALGLKVNQSTITLQGLLGMGIAKHSDQIEIFVDKASKEYKLEEDLEKQVVAQMEQMKVELLVHKGTDVQLLDKIDAVQEVLDDLSSLVSMMKQNKYVKPIVKKVLEYEAKIQGTQDMLDEWLACQRSWIYLKPIFLSEDLKKKMPVEKQKFDQVDGDWQALMRQTQENPFIFDNFDWQKNLTLL